jgi:putative ABC transport system permease protein
MALKKTSPPRLGQWLLRNFLPDYVGEVGIGDYEEIFQRTVEQEGHRKARRWYWSQIIKVLPLFIFDSIYWSIEMFKNYLKIAFRNLQRQKGFSLINVSSLAIGMACTILILLWVQDELSYDRFHENSKYLYQVAIQQDLPDRTNRYAITPAPLAPELKETYPEILEATRIYKSSSIIRCKDIQFREDYLMVDPSFLKMFTFPLTKGDTNTALNSPNSILITQEIAEKYFGQEDPLGKTLNLHNTFDLTVTGVMKSVPHNTHLKSNMLVSFVLAEKLGYDLANWNEYQYYTYVQLDNRISVNDVNSKIKDIIAKIDPETSSKPYLQALTRLHLHSNTLYDTGGRGNIRYIYIFTTIALFVLLIACINFMNLSTARSFDRAKEIAIRKVAGAYRTNIMRQFLGESMFLAFIALIIAVCVIQLFLPFFNNLSGKQLSFNDIGNPGFIIRLLGVALITGIISGSYPAVFLSSFRPVNILKGALGTGSKGSAFRKVLVVVQFSLSIMLIIGAGIAYKQLDYMQNKKLGFDKDQLLYVLIDNKTNPQAYNSFKNEIKQDTRILGTPNKYRKQSK